MHRENPRTNPERRVKGRLFVLSGPSGVGKGTLREPGNRDDPGKRNSARQGDAGGKRRVLRAHYGRQFCCLQKVL